MEWGYRAGGDMEGEGEVKEGTDVDYVKGLKSLERGKSQRRVWKEERGNEESGKRKEATRSLERGGKKH